MTPEEIRELRKALSCTAKELAGALDLEQATVLAWERGELFPTKPWIDKMEALRAKGPSAIPRAPKKRPEPARGGVQTAMQTMRDPMFWELVRKIASHKELRDEVAKLAARYPDPE